MKKSNVEKYFTQKNWTLLEILCIIIGIAALIVGTFVWGGGPIGLPLFAFSLLILICVRSSKIKGSYIDRELQKLIDENEIISHGKNVIKSFDLKKGQVIREKGKCRSNIYVVSLFDFQGNFANIRVYRIDLLSQSIKKEFYTVECGERVILREESVSISGVSKNVNYLVCDEFSSDIPVQTNDINTSEIIQKLCKT